MKRSHLKHVAIKSGCPEDMSLFKKQRNLVVNLNKTTKRAFFNKIEPPKSGGKQFWKACKPLFSSKSNTSEYKILLVDNDKIISDDLKIATVFNTYFSNITHSLNIFHWNSHFKITSEDQISSCVTKYNQHPSILNIKNIYIQDFLLPLSNHQMFTNIYLTWTVLKRLVAIFLPKF